jgi:hypothetical protein
VLALQRRGLLLFYRRQPVQQRQQLLP